ncbi:hypothetical protein [Kribbella sp. NPDC006257]|uniref:hypothetical protein n=1 Tax=Kribbella sp. NPDC006257 TaxID=3156738 RepID=UPI0033A87886
MRRLLSATAIIVAGFTLIACDPAVNYAPDATPIPTRSPSAPPSTPSAPVSYRYDVFQMAKAVPASYHGHDLNPDTFIFFPNLTPTLRPDPLAGRKISPEAGLAEPDAFVSVVVAEATGAVADRYMTQLPAIQPACASITFGDSSDRASVVKRSVWQLAASRLK